MSLYGAIAGTERYHEGGTNSHHLQNWHHHLDTNKGSGLTTFSDNHARYSVSLANTSSSHHLKRKRGHYNPENLKNTECDSCLTK